MRMNVGTITSNYQMRSAKLKNALYTQAALMQPVSGILLKGELFYGG